LKLNRIDLTPSEAAWFSRNILVMLKNMETAAKRDPAILTRTTYKALNSLRESAVTAGETVQSLGEAEDYLVEVYPGRKQRIVISDLISSVHKTLLERVIPEYERRGDHQDYLEKAKAKAEFLGALRRKFK
jgi:hypothetical protein